MSSSGVIRLVDGLPALWILLSRVEAGSGRESKVEHARTAAASRGPF